MSDANFTEKLRSLSFHVGKPGKKLRPEDAHALFDDPKDVGYKLTKDRVMMKHILGGNASDKALKRDASAINEEKLARHKEENRKLKLERIKEKKERFKARYGWTP